MMLTLSGARVNFVLFWRPATKFLLGRFQRILAHRSRNRASAQSHHLAAIDPERRPAGKRPTSQASSNSAVEIALSPRRAAEICRAISAPPSARNSRLISLLEGRPRSCRYLSTPSLRAGVT
jgi:hypothetical protein